MRIPEFLDQVRQSNQQALDEQPRPIAGTALCGERLDAANQSGLLIDFTAAFDPGDDVVDRAARLSIGDRCQRLHAILDTRQQRNQHQHPSVYGLHGSRGFPEPGCIKRQVHRQDLNLAGVRREMAAIAANHGRAARSQDVAGSAVGIREPDHETPPQRLSHGARKYDAVNRGRAQYPEADLHNACDGGVEHRFRVVDTRKGDDRKRIAGQHHQIAARRAVEERDSQAQPDPQCDGQTQEHRSIDECRDEHDGRCAAEQGAQQPVQRLGSHGSGQWLTDDIGSGHRPGRLSQTDGEADVQGEHCRCEAVQREQQSRARRGVHDITRLAPCRRAVPMLPRVP